MTDIHQIETELLQQIAASDSPRDILKSPELKRLYTGIGALPADQRGAYGKQINQLKATLEKAVSAREDKLESSAITPIDVTAPWDNNSSRPELLPSDQGSTHPLTQEIRIVSNIFERMGFTIEDSREIDDQYHMFDTLNFPKDHPARDDYDTFQTVETDTNEDPLVAPAHTSTMQNRSLKKYRSNLLAGEPIAVVVPDRVFRNEDLDATHEHTFYQIEGVYVAKDVTVGNLIETLSAFLSEYYGTHIDVRTNPFYFPFTEPSFELSMKNPFSTKVDDWIELVGCGMIHPNVLRAADIDSEVYTGFAWGLGIDRLVMMKYGVEDVRHFESGKLDFLRQF